MRLNAARSALGTVLRQLLGLLVLAGALSLPLLREMDRSVDSLVAPWGAPPSEFIDLQGQLLHYRDEGPRDDPQPLLLLHGSADSLHSWDGWAKALRGQRRVVRLDLPGFGLTGPWTGAYAGQPYLASAHVGLVADLLDRLKLTRVVLVGQGLGGEVAWRLAAAQPQRVHQLVLLDATGLAVAPQQVPLHWRLLAWPGVGAMLESMNLHWLMRHSLGQLTGRTAPVPDALLRRHLALALREGNRSALRQHLQASPPGSGVASVLGVQAPTLILWGSQDRWVPPSAGQRLQASIAGSQLLVLDGLGHRPQEEDPLRSLAPVKRFIGLGG